MSSPFNVAAVLLRHDTSQLPPALGDVTAYLRNGRFSIARFWRDATYGWVTFPRFDIFGWYDVDLPPAPSSRNDTVDTAMDCLRDEGVALGDYDRFFVVRFPGVDANGGGYDSGAIQNTAAAINSFDSHLWAAHEFGHLLGFDHSFGIPTLGGDQDGDDIDEPAPTYGDPYCIMSAATFGGADPSVDLRAKFRQRDLLGLPNAWLSGPPPSRALVHFQNPLAVELAGRVVHVREGLNDDRLHDLYAAGSVGQHIELIVFHPAGETPAGIGRVYVEFRQPDDRFEGTRWDAGLAGTGTQLDRAGIVVHVVRTPPGSGTPVVFYAGHIILPAVDLDIAVFTPTGPVRVSVADVDAARTGPGAVRVTVRREQGARAVTLFVTSEESRTVIASEMRDNPRWPFMGPFTWETRDVTRTTRYRPFVAGLGGGGTFRGPSPMTTQWSVGGVLLPPPHGYRDVPRPGGGAPVRINYSINPDTRELSLTNRPPDGPYTVPVSCSATAPSDTGSVSTTSAYSAPAREEGWGEDYYRFLDWWHDLTHPIEIEVPGPPTWWLQERFDRAVRQLEVIALINPELATAMEDVMAEVSRAALH